MLRRTRAGYPLLMTERRDEPHDLAHAVEHPLETAEQLIEDAVQTVDEGRSPWTPLIALSGVALIAGAAVVVLLVIAFLVYYIAL